MLNQLFKYNGYLPLLALHYIEVIYNLNLKDKLQIEYITK